MKKKKKDEEAVEVNQTVETGKKVNEVDELRAQAADYLDKWQRLGAEFDNFRKRTAAEKAGMYDNGMRDAFAAILPVLDNFERAMAAVDAEANAENALYKGLMQIVRQFAGVLDASDISEIEALGKPFDPNFHAAVVTEAAEGYEAGMVCGVLMKGYVFKGRVIRHSVVRVAE
jgi:molecular chaperone GrpE